MPAGWIGLDYIGDGGDSSDVVDLTDGSSSLIKRVERRISACVNLYFSLKIRRLQVIMGSGTEDPSPSGKRCTTLLLALPILFL